MADFGAYWPRVYAGARAGKVLHDPRKLRVNCPAVEEPGMGMTSEAKPRADRAGHTIRPGRPTVRTTFQLLADIKRTGDDAWKQALQICGDWLGRKYPEQIPQAVYDGETVELEMPGQSVGC